MRSNDQAAVVDDARNELRRKLSAVHDFAHGREILCHFPPALRGPLALPWHSAFARKQRLERRPKGEDHRRYPRRKRLAKVAKVRGSEARIVEDHTWRSEFEIGTAERTRDTIGGAAGEMSPNVGGRKRTQSVPGNGNRSRPQ